MTTSRPGGSAASTPSPTRTTATTPATTRATTPATTPGTSQTPPTRATTPATTPGTTRATTPERGAALGLTLDPFGADAFLAEHWERRPLVVARDEPGRFDAILSAADVERMVCETGLRLPAFRLVRDGAP